MNFGIIDYGDENTGSGNLNSVLNYLYYLGYSTKLIKYPEDIKKVDKIILPGVGASKHVMKNIKKEFFDSALTEFVIKGGKPFLGICVGMQILAKNLTEFGEHDGLGWIDGDVISLNEILSKEKVIPHMGWNKIKFKNDKLKVNWNTDKFNTFYFAHSYTLIPKSNDIVNSTFSYERELVAGISFKNIIATQFHPEKSQISGEYFLNWFAEWRP